MEYLISRVDPQTGELRLSQYFPAIVEAESPETAIDAVFAPAAYAPSLTERKSYLVVPLEGAVELEVTPARGYQLRVVRPVRLLA